MGSVVVGGKHRPKYAQMRFASGGGGMLGTEYKVGLFQMDPVVGFNWIFSISIITSDLSSTHEGKNALSEKIEH